MYNTSKQHRAVRCYKTKIQKRLISVCYSLHRSRRTNEPTTFYYAKQKDKRIRCKSTPERCIYTSGKYDYLAMDLPNSDLLRLVALAERIYCKKLIPKLGTQADETDDGILEGFSIEVSGYCEDYKYPSVSVFYDRLSTERRLSSCVKSQVNKHEKKRRYFRNVTHCSNLGRFSYPVVFKIRKEKVRPIKYAKCL